MLHFESNTTRSEILSRCITPLYSSLVITITVPRDAYHCSLDSSSVQTTRVNLEMLLCHCPPPLRRPLARRRFSLAPLEPLATQFLVMKFKVGDIVRNGITQEEGCIVRIADLPGYGPSFVVSVAPNPALTATVREVLWRESELTRSS
jgi:hypothetical protein